MSHVANAGVPDGDGTPLQFRVVDRLARKVVCGLCTAEASRHAMFLRATDARTGN